MNSAWQALADECGRWSDAGRRVEFWWRDDDATRPVPALRRLLALAETAGVPLALAVVPGTAEAALFEELGPGVCVLQHGCDHLNRASAGEKKTEFSAGEAVVSALQRLEAARLRLSGLTDGIALDVLVPPWNRIADHLVPQLVRAGIRGLSRFGARRGLEAAPGVRQMNTHVDIIAWKGGRGFAGEDAVIQQAVLALAASRAGGAHAPAEALGWLTHHDCHDDAAWSFLERLFAASQRLPGVRWISARDFFGERRVA